MPLIASYLHSPSVELQETATGYRANDTDELGEFLHHVRLRHAISCTKVMAAPLAAVERRVSTSSALIRDESRGSIRGRLDIPHYLSRRVRNHSWPRKYPILVNVNVMDTPENMLIRASLGELKRVLASARGLALTAERISARHGYRWVHQRESAVPWRDIKIDANVARLRVDTENRVLRRQTGNDAGYSVFLEWLDEWLGTPQTPVARCHERLATGLLAFPVEKFFWDRVFEIWCLTQVAVAIQRAGAIWTRGPCSLSERKNQAIYEFDHQGARIEVWFQRSLPPTEASWRYRHSERPLRGIPDIVITRDGKGSFIIDAKNRIATTATRSEESYKMLGYLENFRRHFEVGSFFGALIFISDQPMETVLSRADWRASLSLYAAHPRDAASCTLVNRLSDVIGRWLDAASPVET